MPLGAANVIFFTNPALTLVLAFLVQPPQSAHTSLPPTTAHSQTMVVVVVHTSQVLRESCTWLDVMALVLSLAGVVCVIRPAVLFGASGAAEAEAEAQRHSNTADGFKVSIVLAGMLCLVASALAAGTFVVIRKLQVRAPVTQSNLASRCLSSIHLRAKLIAVHVSVCVFVTGCQQGCDHLLL